MQNYGPPGVSFTFWDGSGSLKPYTAYESRSVSGTALFIRLFAYYLLQVPVLWIRIRIQRIHMFLGLPDPDPLVRGMDPDPVPDPVPDPSIIMQK